jgi:hypothetical protein
MEYRVQRPTTVWIETKVEAENFDQALELADKRISSGEFEELDNTWETNWDRYWIEDETGETKGDF